jgi:hypothetical protein
VSNLGELFLVSIQTAQAVSFGPLSNMHGRGWSNSRAPWLIASARPYLFLADKRTFMLVNVLPAENLFSRQCVQLWTWWNFIENALGHRESDSLDHLISSVTEGITGKKRTALTTRCKPCPRRAIRPFNALASNFATQSAFPVTGSDGPIAVIHKATGLAAFISRFEPVMG